MENTITVLSSQEEAAHQAALKIATIINTALMTRPLFRLVLSGGSTPKRLYETLSNGLHLPEISWDRVHFFWGDERAVGPDHPKSNYRMACETLLHPIRVSKHQIHRMRAEADDLKKAASEYEEEIFRHFGSREGGTPPSFDMILLGMGEDGHIASLFPKTDAVAESERWVMANYIPKLDSYRLTLTPVILNQAAWVIFLVTGANKADVLAKTLEGPRKPSQLPAQMISPVRGRLLWFLDRAAAGALKTQISSRPPYVNCPIEKGGIV